MNAESRTPWHALLADHADWYKNELEKRDKALNTFLQVSIPAGAASTGLPLGVKDNIAVRGLQLSCGSKILDGLVSPYDATIVARAREAGFAPVGKTNLDEFGMGSSTDNSAGGPTNNPWDTSRVAGGSSGGSAAAVAAGLVPVAFGTDTGGSVRQPASFCGVYGLKPTYGNLSRYGLVAYASSLEVAGVLGESVEIVEQLFGAATGVDGMDQTSVAAEKKLPDSSAGRVAFLSGELGLDSRTAAGYQSMRAAVEAAGCAIEDVELKTAEYVIPAYYTIAAAEASANLARFNGVRYGQRPFFAENPEQLVRSARATGFGSEVKLRVLLGTYVLRSGFQEQYYQRAQRIRTAIKNELAELFSRYDALFLPVFPCAAFAHGASELDAFQQKLADKFTSLANLAGLPALSIPSGVHDGLPVGIQAMGPAFSEARLLDLARKVRAEIPFARPDAYSKSLAELAGERAK
jgi:aspartyl-tRNA(Asn)/glutamyl-tRNA(Gln) amidotransferase subunit A